MESLNLLNLLLVLLAAWLAGSIATRFHYPAVLGELLAGMILGPPLLGLLHGGPALDVLAQVGVLLMMLYIGMEIDPRELGKASWPGLLAALGGFITPFVLAYWVVLQFGVPPLGAAFVGIAAGITSLATKSRILVDLQLLDTRVAHVMLAGALISDSLSLVVFAAILGVVEVGTIELAALFVVIAKTALFFGLTALIGLKVFPYLGQRLSDAGLTDRTFNFTLVLLIAVLFGEAAELAGLHSILGAFIAGLFLRENVLGRTLSENLMEAVRDASIGFLAPIFFVTIGFAVSWEVFRTDLGLFLGVMAAATVGKVLGTALFYLPSGHGWREGIAVGAGMNGRGAVEIVIAGIGLERGLISTDIFSILVFMALFTTAAVPALLKWGTDWLRRRGELVRSRDERRGTLIIGAGPTARELAKILSRTRPVWIVDSNRERCEQAVADGLTAICGNALQEQILAEASAAHADSLVAMTTNPEVNALATQVARNVFLIPTVLVLRTGEEPQEASTLRHLHASALFGRTVDLAEWDHRVAHGEFEVENLRVSRPMPVQALLEDLRDGRGTPLPVAVKRGEDHLPVHSESRMRAGDEVILLRPAPGRAPRKDRFDELAAESPVLDLDAPTSVDEFFQLAAESLAAPLEVPREELARALADRERHGSTVMAPGLAVPHLLVDGRTRFAMLIARSRPGIRFPGQDEPVHMVIVLAGSPDERNFHLRALSAIAQIVRDPEFERRWRSAEGPDALRHLIAHADRPRYG